MTHDNSLISAPIPQLTRRIAIPASIGFLFHTIFNITDTYFAGIIGTQALAALSLSFPVFFVIIAMGSGLQTGATACIATALGSGDKRQARILAAQALIMGLMAGGALTLLGTWISPALFTLLGAEGAYLDDCLAYMQPIFGGTVLFTILYMENAILNAQGDTVSFRNFLIAGAVLNVMLDPWFIHGGLGLPAMGISGVAYATLAVQAVGVVYLAGRIAKKGVFAQCRPAAFRPRLMPLVDIAHQGLPASANMATVGIGIFVITYFISWFGPGPVAAYGIATRIEQIILMPTIGLNVSTLTLTAQNHGAGLPGRVTQTLGTALRYGAWVTTPGTIILFLGAEPLMALFTSDQAVVFEGARYLRIAAFVLYAYVLLYVHVSALQGLKRPLFAIWLGLARQIVAPSLVFWLGITLLGMGVMAVWWGVFGVTWAAAVFATWYARVIIHKTLAETRQDGA